MSVITIQPDGTAGLDTIIVSDAATTNFATDATLGIGENNTAVSTIRSLIKFDLSTVTAGFTRVELVVTLEQAGSHRSSNNRSIGVYRCKRDWVEAQATWNIWKTANNWATAGGFHANDTEQTAIGSTTFNTTDADESEKTFSLDIAAVEAMRSGSFTNNGFLLKADTESNDLFVIHSSESASATKRPKLVFTYRSGLFLLLQN